jgi:hypothetical protein
VTVVELSLALAAFLIGVTGAWSPCGFSMVETVGLAGGVGKRRTTIAACATFAPGAVLGGVATFGLLSAGGEALHGAGGRLAYVTAAAIAAAAALAEARGMRIVPQIRRQLPEAWRWTMPLPLASALYGVLLGLGFTTFVLSFGVWALAGIGIALGDPGTGVVIGAAFGIGRALPVIVVAPAVDTRLGVRCVELMAERPAIYRVFRLGDGVALALVAAALASTATATASRVEVRNGADPSAVGKALAFQREHRSAVLRFAGRTYELPARDPAVGGPWLAVISGGDQINILNRYTRETVVAIDAPGAQAVAASRNWLAYLAVKGGRYLLRARRIEDPAHPGDVRGVASASLPSQIGHPSVSDGQVFYAVSKPRRNAIWHASLRSGRGGKVVDSRTDELLNPSAQGRHLLYVRVDRARQSPQRTSPPRLRQRLMMKRLRRHRPGHRVYSHGPNRTLWTTALSGRRAFVTLLGRGGPRIVSTRR